LNSNIEQLKQINSTKGSFPNYIVIEGPIGIGKTTLTLELARNFGAETLLEDASVNPFLEDFYKDRVGAALPTQLYFLFQRIQQLQEVRQVDIFKKIFISDFFIQKDPLFAGVNLNDDEYSLYRKVFAHVIKDLPKPDLVVYLQASTKALFDRVKKRGRVIEKEIEFDYLAEINDAYTQYFYHYSETPLLIVNTNQVNFSENKSDFFSLAQRISTVKKGRHYYNPVPLD
tara:strand:- start:574 stop:1260 length:687 start_codon:yes stop_codon:yes gene_type:complete